MRTYEVIMRTLKKSPKKSNLLSKKDIQYDTIQDNTIRYETESRKITFRCDRYLLEKIKNSLTSQNLAGNYQHPNFSAFIRAAFGSYQKGMPLTYQRQPNNPKKEICVRLGGELLTFYQRLAPSSKTLILERALGSYYQKLS